MLCKWRETLSAKLTGADAMKVWRKQTTRTRNGQKETLYSKRFYGTLTLASGKRKQEPLTEDKASSLALLKRLQREQDDKRARGVTRQDEQRERPVDAHLSDYEAYLRNKRNTETHIVKTTSRIRLLLAETKTKTLSDLDGQRVLSTLADWRKRGTPEKRKGRKRTPCSVETSNHYLIAIKSFSRWLWRERITPDDPLAGLRRMNAETDRRHKRRALTLDEFATLTSVTQQSNKTYRGNDWRFTPTDRVMLYTIAAYTGLRASECGSLTKSSFNLETLTFTLDASVSKNRKASTLPLNVSLADKLRTWFATLERDTLFQGKWTKGGFGGRMLKRDLKRSGIAYVDEKGRYADFHALRHTFISNLAKAGVHPSKAQRLARHSTITLTMNVYTSLDVDDLRDAVNAI